MSVDDIVDEVLTELEQSGEADTRSHFFMSEQRLDVGGACTDAKRGLISRALASRLNEMPVGARAGVNDNRLVATSTSCRRC